MQLNDAFAHLGGKRFGHTHPFPRISPGKSVEGHALGAAAAALGVVVLHTLVPVLPAAGALPRGALLWFCAVALADGDLTVSAFKRARGVKDSWSVLPGHGGVLDRFGNLFLAAPVFALLLAPHGM